MEGIEKTCILAGFAKSVFLKNLKGTSPFWVPVALMRREWGVQCWSWKLPIISGRALRSYWPQHLWFSMPNWNLKDRRQMHSLTVGWSTHSLEKPPPPPNKSPCCWVCQSTI